MPPVIGKITMNQKIKNLLNEIHWIKEQDLERYQTKLNHLKEKISEKVKSQSHANTFNLLFKKYRGGPKLESLIDPDLQSMLFGGDILLTEDQIDYLLEQVDKEGRHKRQASTVISKWTTPVNYYFDPAAGFTVATKNIIRSGFKIWADNTCVTFAETSTPPNNIKVTNTLGSGCYATMGMMSSGQVMSLPSNCQSIGIAAHEMAHALGVMHQQARYDRNNYVEVHPENIKSDIDSQSQYHMVSPDESNNYGLPYDYGSVMHYPDGRCPSLPCKNSGYPNPSACSKCICPKGFSGNYCDQRPPSTNTAACTGATVQATSTSWTSVTGSLNRPYQQGLTADTCTWWIEAPVGSTLEIQLVSVERWGSCGWSNMEIKAKDLTLTGYKICPDVGDSASVVTAAPTNNCNNVDPDDDCQYWADNGDCVKDETYMSQYCKKMCNLC